MKSLKGHTDVVESLLFDEDNHLLLSSGCDKTIRMWDTRTDRVAKCIDLRNNSHLTGTNSNNAIVLPSELSNCSDKNLLPIAIGSHVMTFDRRGGPMIVKDAVGIMTSHNSEVSALSVCGDCIVVGEEDGTVSVAEFRENAKRSSNSLHALIVNSVLYDNYRQETISCGMDCLVRWGPQTLFQTTDDQESSSCGTRSAPYANPPYPNSMCKLGNIHSPSFILGVACGDGHVHLFDQTSKDVEIGSLEPECSLTAHPGSNVVQVRGYGDASQKNLMVTGSHSGVVSVWDVGKIFGEGGGSDEEEEGKDEEDDTAEVCSLKYVNDGSSDRLNDIAVIAGTSWIACVTTASHNSIMLM
eukprot:PhF_6_TR30414/c0_g1_i2/m.44609